jgi:hypothetical protein
MKQRALIAVKKEIFRPLNTNQYHSSRTIGLMLGEEWFKFQTKYGIELPASTRIV